MIAALHMKPVQDAMRDWSEDDACGEDHSQAAVKCVQAGEELSAKASRHIHGQPDKELVPRNHGLTSMLKVWEQSFHWSPTPELSRVT